MRELVGEGTLESFYDGEREWVMQKRHSLSAEHEVMVEKLHKVIRDSGMDAYIHDRANGPDVVAYGKDGKVAIEYETGSKDLEGKRADAPLQEGPSMPRWWWW